MCVGGGGIGGTGGNPSVGGGSTGGSDLCVGGGVTSGTGDDSLCVGGGGTVDDNVSEEAVSALTFVLEAIKVVIPATKAMAPSATKVMVTKEVSTKVVLEQVVLWTIVMDEEVKT